MQDHSYCAYRLPHEDEVNAFVSDSLISGISDSGFTIAPFDNSPEGIYTIPDNTPVPLESLPATLSGSIGPDTPRSRHSEEIAAIKQTLNGRGKIVAARKISVSGKPDLIGTFTSLCEAYPAAFVFMFHTPASGTWIGATPELLAEMTDTSLRTMALAGTRPAGQPGPWDAKNIEEQQLVTDFITDALRKYYREITPAETRNLKAGPVEHICTPIFATGPRLGEECSGTTPGNNGNRALQTAISFRSRVLGALSPTPAVCGSDRLLAMRVISRFEPDGRGYYAGYCGPAGKYFVTLRSARVFADGVTLYSGSGITPLSAAADEWEETRIKAETLLSHLKFIEKR